MKKIGEDMTEESAFKLESSFFKPEETSFCRTPRPPKRPSSSIQNHDQTLNYTFNSGNVPLYMHRTGILYKGCPILDHEKGVAFTGRAIRPLVGGRLSTLQLQDSHWALGHGRTLPQVLQDQLSTWTEFKPGFFSNP